MEAAQLATPEVIIDELMDLYVMWRESCDEVEAAYQRWASAVPETRVLAHGAFGAALDREDSAAACYRAHAERATELLGGLPTHR